MLEETVDADEAADHDKMGDINDNLKEDEEDWIVAAQEESEELDKFEEKQAFSNTDVLSLPSFKLKRTTSKAQPGTVRNLRSMFESQQK